MRDPQRITEVMIALENLWRKNPDMRFGQLVANLSRGKDLFLIEDDVMLVDIKRTLHSGEWPRLAPTSAHWPGDKRCEQHVEGQVYPAVLKFCPVCNPTFMGYTPPAIR